jgi:putative hydrolase of the HAD superfamily
MRKAITEYKTIILDMDGTLYFQIPVRFCMTLSLVLFYLIHPFRIKELLILRTYRIQREQRAFANDNNFDELQIEILNKKFGLSSGKIKALIHLWMQERPLKYISHFRDKRLISLMENLCQNGSIIVVYSDYPVDDKIAAIGIKPCFHFFSGDPAIQCMKPDTRGLENILKITNTQPDDALLIGDRYSKDGLCAKAMGMDYIILSKFYPGRKVIYNAH